MSAPESMTGAALRRIASRMEARHSGTFLEAGNRMDAAELRSIADAIDHALRPRTRREIEGDAKRAANAGLWASFRRLWSRAA